MTEAKRLTKLVLKFFSARAGFDEWWDTIAPATRKQIVAELEEEFANTVPASPEKKEGPLRCCGALHKGSGRICHREKGHSGLHQSGFDDSSYPD